MTSSRNSLIKSSLAKTLRDNREKSVEKVFEQYKRGFLTPYDVWKNYLAETNDRLYLNNVLRENGIQIRCYTYSQWISMLMDCGDWVAGRPIEDNGAPWLFTLLEQENNRNEAASEREKVLCFEILAALGFCIEEYCICPPGIYKYKLHQRTYNDGSRCTILGKLIDDGGLQKEEHPEGKEYSVFDSYGCEGVIVIRSREKDKYSGREYFSTEGYVRGYTTNKLRPMNVYFDPVVVNNPDSVSVSYFFLHSYSDDEKLSVDCDSRWSVFQRWAERKNARIREYYKSDFRNFQKRFLSDEQLLWIDSELR